MKIAGISSTKAGDVNEGDLKNRRQYQGAFSEYDEDIQWNDFALRNYDPQIARWVQQDPYQQFASPYVALGGDPVNMVDPSGGWSIAAGLSKALGISKIGVAAVSTFVGAIAGAAATAGSGNAKGMIVGAFLGLASNFIGSGGSQAVLQAVVGTGKILLNNAVAMPTVAPPQATISNVGVTTGTSDDSQYNDNDRDKEIQEEFIRLVKRERYRKAVKYLVKKYLNFKEDDIRKTNSKVVIVDDDVTVLTTDGLIKKGATQKIRIPKKVLKLIPRDLNLSTLIRAIAHEYKHVEQRSQDNPIIDHDEREFLAHYYSLMQPSLPELYIDDVKAYQKDLKRYYDSLTPEKKEQYKSLYEKGMNKIGLDY